MNLTVLVEQEFNTHVIGNQSFQKETFMKINAKKWQKPGKETAEEKK